MARESDSQVRAQFGDDTLITFQVAKPVVVPEAKEGRDDCVHTEVLMEHVFGFSYGKPFVGKLMIWFIIFIFVFWLCLCLCFLFVRYMIYFFSIFCNL